MTAVIAYVYFLIINSPIGEFYLFIKYYKIWRMVVW